jgi:hypothetical protein
LAAYLGKDRADVALFQVDVEESPIEIAVVADGRAEGDVNVKANHFRVGELESWCVGEVINTNSPIHQLLNSPIL